MNCPNCDRYVLNKHCRREEKAEVCPWFYCQRCKIDFDTLGHSMPHQILKEG